MAAKKVKKKKYFSFFYGDCCHWWVWLWKVKIQKTEVALTEIVSFILVHGNSLKGILSRVTQLLSFNLKFKTSGGRFQILSSCRSKITENKSNSILFRFAQLYRKKKFSYKWRAQIIPQIVEGALFEKLRDALNMDRERERSSKKRISQTVTSQRINVKMLDAILHNHNYNNKKWPRVKW